MASGFSSGSLTTKSNIDFWCSPGNPDDPAPSLSRFFFKSRSSSDPPLPFSSPPTSIFTAGSTPRALLITASSTSPSSFAFTFFRQTCGFASSGFMSTVTISPSTLYLLLSTGTPLPPTWTIISSPSRSIISTASLEANNLPDFDFFPPALDSSFFFANSRSFQSSMSRWSSATRSSIRSSSHIVSGDVALRTRSSSDLPRSSVPRASTFS